MSCVVLVFVFLVPCVVRCLMFVGCWSSVFGCWLHVDGCCVLCVVLNVVRCVLVVGCVLCFVVLCVRCVLFVG